MHAMKVISPCLMVLLVSATEQCMGGEQSCGTRKGDAMIQTVADKSGGQPVMDWLDSLRTTTTNLEKRVDVLDTKVYGVIKPGLVQSTGPNEVKDVKDELDDLALIGTDSQKDAGKGAADSKTKSLSEDESNSGTITTLVIGLEDDVQTLTSRVVRISNDLNGKVLDCNLSQLQGPKPVLQEYALQGRIRVLDSEIDQLRMCVSNLEHLVAGEHGR